MMYYGGGWVIAGLVILALFLVLILVLIGLGISLIGRGSRTASGSSGPQAGAKADDPLEILRRRYANGEITQEEYQSMREDLAR
jgi:putative membrane protein